MTTGKQGFYLCQLMLWLGFGLLTRFTWIDVASPSWLWIFIYMGIGLLVSSIMAALYQPLVNKSFVQQLLGTAVLSVFFGIGWRIGFNSIEYHLLESANNQFKFWGYFHNGKSAVIQLLVWSAGFWLLHYYRINLLQMQRIVEAESEAKSATLKLLQYQISPHFLFNVLGGIDTLLLKKNSKDARQMLSGLIDFLRSSLEGETAIDTPLVNEIERIKTYLAIEQIRFGERLQVKFQLPTTMPDIAIPTGLLLPVIENGMTHGIAQLVAGGVIEISVWQIDDITTIEVVNNIANTNHNKGFGLGLQNTRHRLQGYYEGNATLKIENSDSFYTVTITLPNRSSQVSHAF